MKTIFYFALAALLLAEAPPLKTVSATAEPDSFKAGNPAGGIFDSDSYGFRHPDLNSKPEDFGQNPVTYDVEHILSLFPEREK